MEFINVIERRYSVRSYRPDPVEPEKIQQVLETARLAPTACNLQEFKIIVMKTANRREELKRIYPRDWFSEAPYVLCVCSIPEKCWVRRDNKNYSDVDAAIVMDHIILAATSLDLGTCWIGAFDAQAAREVLGLDDTMEPVVFTPLGYVQGAVPNRVKKPLSDLVINLD
ncbi:MAG TPA: nitroreductase [Firmicutes bacterium]|jgi:nitroreductase|nr:nitroreductase [Bacillota bacterium]